MEIYILLLPNFIRKRMTTAAETLTYCTLLYWCGGSDNEDMSCFTKRETLLELIPEIKSPRQISNIIRKFEDKNIITVNRTREGMIISINYDNLKALGLSDEEMEVIMKTFSKKKKTLLKEKEAGRVAKVASQNCKSCNSELQELQGCVAKISRPLYIKEKNIKEKKKEKKKITEISDEISVNTLGGVSLNKKPVKGNTTLTQKNKSITRLLNEYSELYQTYFNKIPDVTTNQKMKGALKGIKKNVLDKYEWSEYVEFCFKNWDKMKEVLVWDDNGKKMLSDTPNLYEMCMAYKLIVKCMEEGIPASKSENVRKKMKELDIKVIKL